MTHFNKIIFILTFCFSASFLASCQTINNNGQVVSQSEIQEINNTNPSKEELVEMIGSPTYVPDYNKDIWYYIERTCAKHVYSSKSTISQRIVQVKFSGNNAVEAKIVDNIRNKDFTAEKSYTKTYGSDKTGVQKFFGNLGKFNASAKKKK